MSCEENLNKRVRKDIPGPVQRARKTNDALRDVFRPHPTTPAS
jgi:hypothetical protein